MRIIIKEFEDFTIDSVTVLLKKQAPKPISLYEIEPKYNFDDIVIISERDTEAKACNYKPAQLFTYEEIFSKIGNYILEAFYDKYDYYYLKKTLQKACTNKNIDTIITGSSYAIFGIDENLLSPNAVNLSMISQDLYYSIKLVYESYKYNKNIKKVVIICGYYYFFSDLSLSKTASELLRISKVYLPLFDDIHNCMILPKPENKMPYSKIFDFEKILNEYENVMKPSFYFSDIKKRELCAIFTWKETTKKWNELSDKEKIQAGKTRAEMHNKSIKHTTTLEENSLLLNNFLDFCKRNDISLFFVTAPMSECYAKELDKDFKNIFYNVLNNANGVIHLIDTNCFQKDFFNDDDFIDTDHLSDSGAKKLTEVILSEIVL